MNIKKFVVDLVKKVLNQKINKDGDQSSIQNIGLQILTNKSLDYIARGSKKFVVEMIMDRFVPRDLRKKIQDLSFIDDRLRDTFYRFADKMNDDGLKEEAFVLAMSAAKKVTQSLDQIVDDTINRIKLTKSELAELKEKIETKIINLSVDDDFGDMVIDVNTVIDSVDGFEEL